MARICPYPDVTAAGLEKVKTALKAQAASTSPVQRCIGHVANSDLRCGTTSSVLLSPFVRLGKAEAERE